jgi:putative two-component system response regulator
MILAFGTLSPSFGSISTMNTFKPTVLIVDDTPEALQLLNSLLKDQYRLRFATRGDEVLDLALQDSQPDLVLLDVLMPGTDGYEVCRLLKAHPLTREIPVIFLTARNHVSDQEEGFRCGCVDFISKPISPALTLARVATHVSLKQAKDRLSERNRTLAEEVAERTIEVQQVQDVTITAMASLAETRDNETGMHILRTQNYVKVLAARLHQDSPYSAKIDEYDVNLMYKSAPLHDIGKVGISDAILLKPGRLTAEEFVSMKLHPLIGAKIIEKAEKMLSAPSSFLRFAREIARHHHENWDGSGYPDGLAYEAIPLSARLMAVADVYDALISRRCYKSPLSHDESCEMIVTNSGSKFDPVVIDVFKDASDQFAAIAQEYRDSMLDSLDGVVL